VYNKLHNLDQAIKHTRHSAVIHSLGGDHALLKICEEILDGLLPIHDYLTNNKNLLSYSFSTTILHK
jgi:hypothetical protein